MVAKAGTRMSYHSGNDALIASATRHCDAWQWLVVAFSAKQKQQLHHQQLFNGSTILKMFTCPDILDLF
jgi:hypothetical protein